MLHGAPRGGKTKLEGQLPCTLPYLPYHVQLDNELLNLTDQPHSVLKTTL